MPAIHTVENDKIRDKGSDNFQHETLSHNWKATEIPQQQRTIADAQLKDLRQGIVHPVFASLRLALQAVKSDRFSLLDAACASGYYYEVIHSLDRREIAYTGSDYSSAMIKAAKTFYPDGTFEVQDATQTNYADRQFDVVLLSGVIEHIPAYHKAIAEGCRLAREYLIIHRCPLTSQKEHESTVNIQYGVETLKMYFSKPLLVNELQEHEFSVIQEIETYKERSFKGKIRQIKHALKLFGPRQSSSTEETHPPVQTLVFCRQSPKEAAST